MTRVKLLNLQQKKLPKLRLMDSQQSHDSDKMCISHRGIATTITNDANKINEKSTEFHTPRSLRMLVHRQRVKDREERVKEVQALMKNTAKEVMLEFEGKKIFNIERLVVVAQFIDEEVNKCEEFVGLRSFLEDNSITSERVFDVLVDEMFSEDMLKKVEAMMSNTTSLNTGCRKGINICMKKWFKRHQNRDVHVFECQLHINELFLSHELRAVEGDTKAPNKMQAGSVYNLIEQLDPGDLVESKLLFKEGSPPGIQVSPWAQAYIVKA